MTFIWLYSNECQEYDEWLYCNLYRGVFFCRENFSADKGSHWVRSSSLKWSTGGNSASNSDERDASLHEPLLLVVVAGVGVNVGEFADISGVIGVFLSSFFSTLSEAMFLGLFAKTSFEGSMPSSFIGCPGERRRRTWAFTAGSA